MPSEPSTVPHTNMSTAGEQRISFSVISNGKDSRKYKVYLKASDVSKLKVEKIKKTLVKVTGFQPGSFELHHDGIQLQDHWLGSEFNLRENTTLFLTTNDESANTTHQQSAKEVIDSNTLQATSADNTGQHRTPETTTSPSTCNWTQPQPPSGHRSDSPHLHAFVTNHQGTPPTQNTTSHSEHQTTQQQQSGVLAAQHTTMLPCSSSTAACDPQCDPQQQTTQHTPRTTIQQQIESLTSEQTVTPLALQLEGAQYNNLQQQQMHQVCPQQATISTSGSTSGSGSGSSSSIALPQTTPSMLQSQLLQQQPSSAPTTTLHLHQQHPPASQGTTESPYWQQERRDLYLKCTNLEEQNKLLEAELEDKRKEFGNEKIGLMQKWEDNQHQWGLKQQEMVRDWENQKNHLIEEFNQDKDRWLRQGGISDQHASEKAEWEREKEQILRSWKEETDILTTIWNEDKEEWNKEKKVLLSSFDAQRDKIAQDKTEGIVSMESDLEIYRQQSETLKSEVASLQHEKAQSLKENEQNKLFVLGAAHALDELRDQINSGDHELAQLVVRIAAEKCMEKEKAARLMQENVLLSQQYKQELTLRKQLHNTLEDIKGNVRVIVRVRPYLSRETPNGINPTGYDEGKVEVVDGMTVSITTPTAGAKPFDFFRALSMEASQEEVFEEVRPLMQSTLDGFNVCIMAYGQTGSGKTYTILGDTQCGSNNSRIALHDENSRGVIPRAIEELYALLNSLNEGTQFGLQCSMVELYLDCVHDLLSPNNKKCELRQYPMGLSVVGSAQHPIRTPADAMMLLEHGASQRQVHSTNVNPNSSRSHTIFTIQLKVENGLEEIVTQSKLVFVDLAGSERISKSHSVGDRLKEAQHINKSLSALGDVIAALSQRKPTFIPYRNSKLTMLLQESLGGNSKTVLFANICPSGGCVSETLSTLAFAARVKHVRNPFLKNITKAQNAALTAAQMSANTFRGQQEANKAHYHTVTAGLPLLQDQQMLHSQMSINSNYGHLLNVANSTDAGSGQHPQQQQPQHGHQHGGGGKSDMCRQIAGTPGTPEKNRDHDHKMGALVGVSQVSQQKMMYMQQQQGSIPQHRNSTNMKLNNYFSQQQQQAHGAGSMPNTTDAMTAIGNTPPNSIQQSQGKNMYYKPPPAAYPQQQPPWAI